jgi:hypothetical protein
MVSNLYENDNLLSFYLYENDTLLASYLKRMAASWPPTYMGVAASCVTMKAFWSTICMRTAASCRRMVASCPSTIVASCLQPGGSLLASDL